MGSTAVRRGLSPLLRLAILSGTHETIARHLAAGAHPDARDADGRTALMLAAERGRLEICMVLTEAGANVDLMDGSGRTAREIAAGNGHPDIELLLAPPRTSAEASDVEAHAPQLEGTDWAFEDWEAEADLNGGPTGDAEAAVEAACLQTRIAEFQPDDTSSDWSDVVVELPPPTSGSRRAGHNRISVRFRRLHGRATAAVRLVESGRRARDTDIVPLDLARDPDEILSLLTVSDVVRGSDASHDLRRYLRRAEFGASVADFLADADAEARFSSAGLSRDDVHELTDVINGFTLLLHQQARERAGPPLEGKSRDLANDVVARAPQKVAEPEPPAQVAAALRHPDEILSSTFLAQIILQADASPALRRAFSQSPTSSISAAAFLQEEEPQKLFAHGHGIGAREIFELTDLVNAYATLLFHEWARRGER